MAVAVEGNHDRRMAEVGTQGLRIQSSGDPDAGVGAAVDAERFECRLRSCVVGWGGGTGSGGGNLAAVGDRSHRGR